MKVLLTSCGFETEEIKNVFMDMLTKDTSEMRALFIPTAAVFPDAIEVLPLCMKDLLDVGIKKKNISVYDMHKIMDISEFDMIYLCGGAPQYLLNRVNEIGFDKKLHKYIAEDGIVVGVSAGSIIFANNLEDNLGLLPCRLDVHCDKDNCEKSGKYNVTEKGCIRLGNEQVITFNEDNTITIIG